MVDESYFRMPDLPTPDSNGSAPIFAKYVTYNKRKDTFSNIKNTFDSYRNFFNFFLIIYLFKDEYMDELELLSIKPRISKNDDNNISSIYDIGESTDTPIPRVEADIVSELTPIKSDSDIINNIIISTDNQSIGDNPPIDNDTIKDIELLPEKTDCNNN